MHSVAQRDVADDFAEIVLRKCTANAALFSKQLGGSAMERGGALPSFDDEIDRFLDAVEACTQEDFLVCALASDRSMRQVATGSPCRRSRSIDNFLERLPEATGRRRTGSRGASLRRGTSRLSDDRSSSTSEGLGAPIAPEPCAVDDELATACLARAVRRPPELPSCRTAVVANTSSGSTASGRCASGQQRLSGRGSLMGFARRALGSVLHRPGAHAKRVAPAPDDS